MASNPVVVALATQRLTQLVVEDEIAAPLRRIVSEWAAGSSEGSFKERVDFALNCEACASVYASAAVLIASRFTTGRWLLLVLAGSSAALGVKAVIDKISED